MKPKSQLSDDERVRIFQRKLYQKAKQEKTFRFYILYDKLYLPHVLREAYRRVKKNGGSGGLDNKTFSIIEEQGLDLFLEIIHQELKNETYKVSPVKRVFIEKDNGKLRPLGIPIIKDRVIQMSCKMILEPIFEADFIDSSYGFRPKRGAGEAIENIYTILKQGRADVFDADLSGYFDTIPHDKLILALKERISDNRILKLILMWLKAPIIEKDKSGKSTTSGGKKNKLGTPQGGVISPLLANIYLNLLDRIICNDQSSFGKNGITIVRYADDFVLMGYQVTPEVLNKLKELLDRMGLKLNMEKSKLVNARENSFAFLGFTIRLDTVENGTRRYWNVIPSNKSMSKLKAKIKDYLRTRSHLPIPIVVKGLNQKLFGWLNYFNSPSVSRIRNISYSIKNHLDYKLVKWFKSKSQRRCKLYRQQPYNKLVKHFGLIDVVKYAFTH